MNMTGMLIQKVKRSLSQASFNAGGGFYAYFMNNPLCSAYGDTPDEACENLEQLVDEFVSDMYMVEEFV
jgi:predicted RNase H-like HicB family nuclease